MYFCSGFKFSVKDGWSKYYFLSLLCSPLYLLDVLVSKTGQKEVCMGTCSGHLGRYSRDYRLPKGQQSSYRELQATPNRSPGNRTRKPGECYTAFAIYHLFTYTILEICNYFPSDYTHSVS